MKSIDDIINLDFDLDVMLKYLAENKNFSYSRFGDGEWNAILGVNGRNCDGHVYFKDLGQRLKAILEREPSYYLGLQRLAYNIHNKNELFAKLVNQNRWTQNEIIHRASIKGRMNELLNALSKREVILVANKRFKGYRTDVFNVHIEIPDSNCWNAYKSLQRVINYEIKKDSVIVYCASMMSEVLIDDFSGRDITQIDFGSALDPYVGKKSRGYHKNLRI